VEHSSLNMTLLFGQSDFGGLSIGLILAIIFGLWFLSSAIKVLPEYKRAVLFRLGRLAGQRGPGLILIFPIIDNVNIVDLRTITYDVPAQEVITRDNVTIRVNAVCYFRVLDPVRAIVDVRDYIQATSQISQTTLRSILGESELDELLSEREIINQKLQELIDKQTEPWGIKVSIVEVKDVELPEGMKRAMARQAEAERERRAKIIGAEAELQASEKLTQAAAVMGAHPIAIQLRYLQTLVEVAAEKNSTTIFPLPIDLLKPFVDLAEMSKNRLSDK
jgi:regulator of protease activity HflC (stomatin/prohibitin superfamily)